MNYHTVVGLEIHVQLKTKSKMFCGCDNKADEAAPNTLVCPVCMGYPGVLPVANQQAIEWVIKTGLALNCQIAEFSKFDRKHYYYPDLPKNYQISQYNLPFCIKGHLGIWTGDNFNRIRIRRVHLEEDAGKLIHKGGGGFGRAVFGGDIRKYTLVDLNRAGTPLMEIVTEPDIESPQEAKTFMQKLRSILQDLDVSDADMEKGHLRCDANISVAEKTRTKNGTPVIRPAGIPVEIKNLNSFRMVEKALIYEEQRQIKEINEGGTIDKETRGWDDKQGITILQRSKEFAQDYRYFPEPDLPPFSPHKAFDLEKLKKEIAELLADRQKRIDTIAEEQKRIITMIKNEKDYRSDLHASWVKNLIEEPILEENFIYFIEKGLDKLFALAFVSHQMWGKLKTGTNPNQFNKAVISEILEAWWEKNLNNIKAKEYFELSLTSPQKVEDILKAEVQIPIKELEKMIDKVISENPKPVADIKAGKTQAMGFLVGLVMKETSGKANPTIVNKILKQRIQ